MKLKFGREHGREKQYSTVTPFPILIDPEPSSALKNTSHPSHAVGRADIARNVLLLDPCGGPYDDKQREVTSSTVLGIINALDSLGTLDLSVVREKISRPSREGFKLIYNSSIGKGKGKENDNVSSKDKDEKSLLVEHTGTQGFVRRNGHIDILAMPPPKSEPVVESQLHKQDLLNMDVQKSYHNFPRESISSSDKRDVSPEEIIHRLFQEYRVGSDNTQLLSEALAYVTPEELEIEISRAFYKKCQTAQALVFAQIPWASAVADRFHLLKNFRNKQDKAVSEVTPQEKLVAALLRSNEALCEALKVYDDLETAAVKHDVELIGSEQRQSGISSEECHPLASALHLDDGLSRIPTPPPSYEAPPVIRPLPLLPKDTIDMVGTHTSHSISSTTNYSQEYERPSSPQSLEFIAHVPPEILGEPHAYLLTSQISELSEASESITSPFRPISCSQTSSDSLVQSIASMSSETMTIPENTILTRLSISSMAHITPNHQNNQGAHTPTMQNELSPVQKDFIVSVPDLTGRITREGDYPASRGGFGDVWRCVLRSQPSDCTVAVKVLHSYIHDADLEGKFAKRIRREILVWQRLNHENVLPLLGTVSHFGRYMSLVSPWMENGSLMQYLQECADDMGLVRRLQLACEVAAGLTYLHSSRVIHGDLTGSNILITDEGKACLCDFGLSSLMLEFHDTTFCTSTVGGNARWAAPEMYRITPEDVVLSATTQSDVYSLGSIMLQILSGKVPYHYLTREGQVLLELHNGNKPRRPLEDQVNDVLWDKINECWEGNPIDRPTSDSVLRFLTRQFKLEKSIRLH